MVRRYDHRAADRRLERGDDGIVPRHPALEEDALAHLAVADDAVHVVLDDGVGQPRGQVGHLRALLLVMHQVRLHKDGAALAQRGRTVRAKRPPAEVVLDADLQPVRLFFQEGAGARGACAVHGEVDYGPVL